MDIGARPWLGWWIAAVGCLHTGFGFIVYSQGWRAIADNGFFNAVDGTLVREHAFWFTFPGPLFILLGVLLIRIEKNMPLVKVLGWSLVAMVAVSVFLMPVSGFWLFLPAVVAILRR